MSVEAVDRTLNAAYATRFAPGFVAAATSPNGGDYHRAFGNRGMADPAPMTLDTLFWIASMTKVITSIAALQLVEQGGLSLDEDAAKILPGIAAPPILQGFDEAGAPRTRPGTRPVTLRHLLTHTSGFGYAFMSADLARFSEHAGLGVENALAMPRLFEAGERWHYGVSTDFVGQMVEAVSGLGLDAYPKLHVFDVLGMDDTTFALSPDQQRRQAAMHARGLDGSLAPMPFAPAPPPNPMLGGGGLWSTAGDYLVFLKALLNDGAGPGGRILKAETMPLLTSNQVGALDCGRLTSSNAMFTNDFAPVPGVAKRWSLGLMVTERPGPDGRGAGSLAWAGLSNCYYWLDPNAGVAGVILMQILPFADTRALEVFSAFERAVYA